jgi:hypothetical protein
MAERLGGIMYIVYGAEARLMALIAGDEEWWNVTEFTLDDEAEELWLAS